MLKALALVLLLPAISVALQGTCGGNLSGSGVITSPSYPANYPNNSACTWDLQATPGRVVVLQFTAFRVEEDYDFLYVYSGNALVASFTGYVVPPRVVLNATARLVFQSDGSVRKKGFSLIFLSRVLQCGGLRAGAGIITSPNYPRPYPNNADCTWTVVATRGSRVRLQFNDIDIEPSNHDKLLVHDGVQSVATYSGVYKKVRALNLGGTVTLAFTSNVNVTRAGFRVEVSGNGNPGPPARQNNGKKTDVKDD